MNMYAMLVQKAFMDADKDNSGYIDRYELKDVLCKMAKDLKLPMVTNDDVNRYLAKLDIDGNGVITIDEFGKLFQEMIATKRSKTI